MDETGVGWVNEWRNMWKMCTLCGRIGKLVGGRVSEEMTELVCGWIRGGNG